MTAHHRRAAPDRKTNVAQRGEPHRSLSLGRGAAMSNTVPSLPIGAIYVGSDKSDHPSRANSLGHEGIRGLERLPPQQSRKPREHPLSQAAPHLGKVSKELASD